MENNTAKLLNHLMTNKSLKRDADIARFLDVQPPVISKLRKGRLGLSGDMILRIHDRTAMHVDEIRELAGVQTFKAAA